MLDIFPQDEYGLYEPPAVKVITAISGSVVPIIGADPTRVVLILSVSTVNGSALVAPAGLAAAGQGILLLQALNVMVLTKKDHGALCQLGWDSFGTAVGNNVTAISLSLHRNPAMYGFKGVFMERQGESVALPPMPPLPAPRSRRTISLPPAVLAAIRSKCPLILGEG